MRRAGRAGRLACALALLVGRAGAGTTAVTTTADNGFNSTPTPGSLRAALVSLGNTPGVTTISFQAGSGGTISLPADLPSFTATAIFDFTSANSSVTIQGSPFQMPLGGSITMSNNDTTKAALITAVMSGVGSLTKTGAGELDLTGVGTVNTYTGGTTLNTGTILISTDGALGASTALLTLSGGTLRINNSITSSREWFLTQNATFDLNGHDSTLAGEIAGPGTLIKNGAGTLFLTGTSSFGGLAINQGMVSALTPSALGGNGAVTFAGGATLQTGQSGAYGNPLLLNGAATVDLMGNSDTFSGVISGAGSLTVISTGALTLNAANTYTGGTIVNSGMLVINGDLNLGDPTAPGNTLTLMNGATLQMLTTQVVTTARGIVLAGGGTLDVESAGAGVSGVISGTGGLTKMGAGFLALSGASTYTGPTWVSSGTLQLAAQAGVNGPLPSATDLTIMPGATFDMQGFHQKVNSYGGGGAILLAAQKGATNLAITGNANFTGSTLQVSVAPQTIKNGDTFKVVTYGTNAGGTQFASIQSPAAVKFTDPSALPAYNANDLTLTATLVPFSVTALNANQAAVGNALEPLRANPTGDAASVLATLYTLNTDQLRTALDQVGPVALGSMSGISLAASGVQSAGVSQRMSVLAQGGGSGFSNYTVSRPSPYPGTLLASAEEMGAVDEKWQDAGDPWGFFTGATATTGRVNELVSPSGTQPGYAFNSGGLLAGADYRLSDHVAAGGTLGMQLGHASLYAPGFGTVDNRSLRYGVYSTAFREDARADIYLGGAADFFTTNRGIAIPGLPRTATASPFGAELNVRPSASYDLRVARWGIVSPFAALNYDRLMIGGFTEDGAGALNLKVAPQTAQSAQSTLGLRYCERFIGDSIIAIPYGSLGWRHELVDQSRTIGAQFASGSGGSFSVATGGVARDGTLIGFGVALQGKRTVFKFDYAGDFRSHFQDSLFNLSARFKF